MSYSHGDLELAEKQIHHAEHLIALHQRTVDRLVGMGESTRPADRLMEKMRAGLAARHRHLDDIKTHLQDPAAEAEPSEDGVSHAEN